MSKTASLQSPVSPHTPGTPTERRSFDFFHKNTSVNFSGFFNSDFWNRVILAAGNEEDCLRHALVAVSALHERFEAGFPMRPKTACDNGYMFALAQYNKSIQKLNTGLSAGQCSPEVALMCCALYICFESFRGVTKDAAMHLKSGIKILIQRSTGNNHTMNSGFNEEIRHLMCRLGCQINSDMQDVSELGGAPDASMGFMAQLYKSLYYLSVPHITSTFQSLNDARHQLFSLINAHLYYYYSVFEYNAIGHEAEIPLELRELRQPIMDGMNRWSETFGEFMQEKGASLTISGSQAAATLLLHFKFQYIMIFARFLQDGEYRTGVLDEKVFDRYRDDWEEGLDILEQLMGHEADSDENTQNAFYPEIGVLAPLFFLVMKCRDPMIRRRGMNLLASKPRREGTWDSGICLRILKTVIAAEEAAAVENGNYEHRISSTALIMGDDEEADVINLELRAKDASRYYVEADDATKSQFSLSPISTGGTISSSAVSEEMDAHVIASLDQFPDAFSSDDSRYYRPVGAH